MVKVSLWAQKATHKPSNRGRAMKLGKAFGTIGALTMVSRVLGFAREIVSARIMGAGPAAEVFALAFMIPNLFRRLFGEGAFSSGFVPLFSKRLNNGNGIEDAKEFAEEVLAVFAPVLMAVTAIFMIAMPLFIGLLAPDSWATGDTRMADAIELTRITMPYMVLICLVSLASGVVNSLNRFTAAAFAPALLNVALVGALLFEREGGMVTARTMAWGVLVGGVLQLGLLWWSMAKAGVKLSFRRPKMTPAVTELVVLILPATLAGGIYYLSQFFYAYFATRIDGALVYLNQADRLNQLPLAIIGSALGTAILPAVSRAIDSTDKNEAGRIQGQAVDLGMLLTFPATAALMALSGPIMSVLFEGGKMTAEDAGKSAMVLSILVSGLPAYVLIKVLTPGFYARKDMKTPVTIGLIALGLGVLSNFILVPVLGLAALPLSTSLAAWLNCIALYVILHNRGHYALNGDVALRVTRQLISALIMGIILWFMTQMLSGFAAQGKLQNILALGATMAAGGIAYFGIGWIIGAINKDDVLILLKRKKAA
jgi:putative peptidoglycan lipid II flippase